MGDTLIIHSGETPYQAGEFFGEEENSIPLIVFVGDEDDQNTAILARNEAAHPSGPYFTDNEFLFAPSVSDDNGGLMICEAPLEDHENFSTPPGSSKAYSVHKLVKQVPYRGIFAGVDYFRAVQAYQMNTVRYHKNRQDVIFNDPTKVIYMKDNVLGRASKRVFLPAKFRGNQLSDQQRAKLQSVGYANNARAAQLIQWSNGIRLVGDIGSLAICAQDDQGCTLREATVIAFDGFSAGVTYPGALFEKIGGRLAKEATGARSSTAASNTYTRAYSAFRNCTYLYIASNIARITGGMVKVGIEVHSLYNNPEEANLSALIDGGVDIGQGGAWLVYNTYFLKRTAVIRKSNIGRAVEALSTRNIPLIPAIKWLMRGAGVVGNAPALITSSYSVYSGITVDGLQPNIRRDSIISGSMGVASSLLFMGSAFFITPASLPIGLIMFTGGALILLIQTLYDEWDGITFVVSDFF